MLAFAAPLMAIGLSELLAVDARSILIATGAVLVAVWRPYRDWWLKTRCNVRMKACASH